MISTLEHACEKIPCMSSLENPPVIRTVHAIRQEAYDPSTLLLPIVGTAI